MSLGQQSKRAVTSATAALVLLACGSSNNNNQGSVGNVGLPATGINSTGIPGSTNPTTNPNTIGTPGGGTLGGTGGMMIVGGTMATGGVGAPVAGTGGTGSMMMQTVPMTGTAGAGSAGGTWTATSRLDMNGNLIAPAAGEGYQIATPMFTLQPGQEVYNCFRVALPNDAVFPVGEWDSQMSPGSHHFILYRADNDAQATAAGVLTNGGCTAGFGGTTWLYTQGSPRNHLAFPDGVAMEVTAHEKVNFDMHYINTTSSPLQARVVLNIYKVKAAMYQKADAQVSFNVNISIPPNGMQTVGGDCTPPAGASFFVMATHMHKRGILAQVNRKLADGTMGEVIVKTTNWDNPDVATWPSAPFLTFKAGEKFHYKCTFMNDRATTVTVGTSAETNEMCMAEGYFFPASGTTPACTSDVEQP